MLPPNLKARRRGRSFSAGTAGTGPRRLVDFAVGAVPLLSKQTTSTGPPRCLYRLSARPGTVRSALDPGYLAAALTPDAALVVHYLLPALPASKIGRPASVGM